MVSTSSRVVGAIASVIVDAAIHHAESLKLVPIGPSVEFRRAVF
jgi:hypothetical protein